MVHFLKKYWINLSLAVILSVLIVLFIPNEESHYLQPDAESIKEKTRLVLIWTDVAMFSIILILVVRNFKNISEFVLSIVGILSLCLAFFFFFDSVFLSATFILNRLKNKGTIEKKYTVTYFEGATGRLMLYDEVDKKGIFPDARFLANSDLRVKVRDTLTISFKKGLLGFNFDPRIERMNEFLKATSSKSDKVY